MTPFEVIVLGASGTYPKSDGACTGYLLRQGEYCVWVDAGSGTFANLQRHISYYDLRAVILSHMHIDHILDLYSLYYALRYAGDSPGPKGLEVYAPAGAEAHLAQLVSPTTDPGFGGYLDFRPLNSSDRIEIEPFLFSFIEAVHPVETLSMRIEASGRTLVYTADTGWNDELVEFARGADVLIAEASLQAPNHVMREVHMTAEEAGDLAERSGAGRLVLTHIVPGLDPQVSLEQARSRFQGEVQLAIDNEVLEV
ncbi:MAG: MBL fold metallo-hydrolase [Actinomycetota bacterium]